MATREFTGFGGIRLRAELYGDEDHSAVLLLPGAMQTRAAWRDTAASLARAGRHVVCLDLRGHGDSDAPKDGNYSLDAFLADLVAVLAQLASRPLIVGSTFGGWLAMIALGESQSSLATGLVMTDPPPLMNSAAVAHIERSVAKTLDAHQFDAGLLRGGLDFRDLESRLVKTAGKLVIPTLIVSGGHGEISAAGTTEKLASQIQNCEVVEILDGGHYVAFDRADEFNAVLLEFAEQHAPRDAPEYVTGSDARTLRSAMGCFATGVAIVTTRDEDGRPVGLTANSISSVSLDPALMLFCLDNGSSLAGTFEHADAFAINVLHIGQQPASNRFATSGIDRFETTPWETWDRNVPIISHSLASFECRRHHVAVHGDHRIVIGEVTRARFEPRRDPLLFHSGRYRRLHLS